MKYQVVLLGTPWNQKELTHGVLSLPGLSLVELDELNMNRPFLCLYFGQSDKDSILSNDVKGIVSDIIKHHALLPITMFLMLSKHAFLVSSRLSMAFFL